MIDKDAIKQSLTVEQIISFMTKFGSGTPIVTPEGYYIFQTICHNHNNPDAKYKLYYYPESQAFHCYTHCACNYDIYSLAQKIFKERDNISYSFPEIVQYISNFFGISSTEKKSITSDIREEFDYLKKWEDMKNSRKENFDFENANIPTYNPNVLEVFSYKPIVEWRKEGIALRTLHQFKIGYYVVENQITIPYFNEQGELIGIKVRNLTKEIVESGKKYMPAYIEGISYRFPSSLVYYGTYQNKKAIEKKKKIILFEGEKSVMKCNSWYDKDSFALAVSGSNISRFQRDMALKMGIKEIIIAFDKEYTNKEEEKSYKDKIKKLAYKFSPYINTYVLWDREDLLDHKDAPCDKGKDVLEELLRNKIQITT